MVVANSTGENMVELRRWAIALVLLSGGFVASVDAATVWFSDQPPNAEWSKRARHAHGGMVERGRGGVYVKRLWLREGAIPASATYTRPGENGSLSVFGVDGKNVTPELFKVDSGGGITFPMPDEGFYNAYFVERSVEDDVLETSIVKAEVLKHSCGEGHDPKFTASRMPPRGYAGVALDIIRERLPGEDFHTRMKSGDKVAFRVHYEGHPAVGADVSLTTQAGWTKRMQTDENGRAVFELIRDYYPAWNDFDKRHYESFLVTAEYRTELQGELNGTPFREARYRATLPGTFYPSELEYSSYLIGLLVTFAAAALTAGGVFLFRLKRRRAVRERFDEKA